MEVARDLLAEPGALDVGGPEVDPGPHARVDVLLQCVGEAVEGPGGPGFVAGCAEGDPVGAEEVLQRPDDRAARAIVARGVLGERRRDERGGRGHRRGRIEQRCPCRVGPGCRGFRRSRPRGWR